MSYDDGVRRIKPPRPWPPRPAVTLIDPRAHAFAESGPNERQCLACGRREIWCGEDFGGWRDSTRIGDPRRAPCASWDLDAR